MKAEVIFKDGYAVEVNTGVGPQGPQGPKGEKGERGDDAAVNALAIQENNGKVVVIKDSAFAAVEVMSLIPNGDTIEY